jgi:hypothetical protein
LAEPLLVRLHIYWRWRTPRTGCSLQSRGRTTQWTIKRSEWFAYRRRVLRVFARG